MTTKLEVIKTGDFVKRYAKVAGVSQKEAKARIAEFNETVEEVLLEGLGVKLGNYMTLRTVIVPERDHVNPATGGKVTKPEHVALRGQVAKPIKEKLASLPIQ